MNKHISVQTFRLYNKLKSIRLIVAFNNLKEYQIVICQENFFLGKIKYQYGVATNGVF